MQDVVAELGRLGVCIQGGSWARDLGVGFTAGGPVDRTLTESRANRKDTRAKQALEIKKIERCAGFSVPTGAIPMGNFRQMAHAPVFNDLIKSRTQMANFA